MIDPRDGEYIPKIKTFTRTVKTVCREREQDLEIVYSFHEAADGERFAMPTNDIAPWRGLYSWKTINKCLAYLSEGFTLKATRGILMLNYHREISIKTIHHWKGLYMDDFQKGQT